MKGPSSATNAEPNRQLIDSNTANPVHSTGIRSSVYWPLRPERLDSKPGTYRPGSSIGSRENILDQALLSDVIRWLGGPEVKNGRIPAFWRGGTNPNSVSIDDRRGGWCDFGSGLSGGILDLVARVLGCDRRAAWQFVKEHYAGPMAGRPDFSPTQGRATKSECFTNDQVRIDWALAMWRKTVPLPGTTAEDYYRSRRLSVDGLGHVVRFHPEARFGPKRHPCVVALMRDIVTDEPCGIHRTALDDGGLKIARRMLGGAKGSAIKLVNDVDVTMGLGISEGVETALSISQAGWSPVWALGSAGAIERFPVLPGVEHLTLWADHDDVGLAAAKTCAQRWAGSGAAATIRYPEAANSDFNDRRPA